MPGLRARPDGKLAIVAGTGALPRLIAERRRARELPYLVITFHVPPPDWVAAHPHAAQQFEKVGRLFRTLRREDVTHVVFAGGMNRPRVKPWRLDAKGVTLVRRVIALLSQGDDTMLKGLAAIFEEEGFTVVGAQDCVDDLTAAGGILGRHAPADEDRRDAARGADILAALGPVDVGQAVVVARGICLGIEAIEGTDALLARVATLPEERRRHCPPPSGVLVKLAKAGQDRRIDLPTIGRTTVEGAARAGLRGIVVEAGVANIIDRDATVAAADAAGLFLWSAPVETLRE